MSSLWAQDAVVQDGNAEFPMSPDSLKGEVAFLPVPETYRLESEVSAVVANDKAEAVKAKDSTQQTKPEVLLIPFGEIKTSYSGKADNDAIFLLNRAINLTQLQYKSEHEYTPVSAQQTVDRVQSFLAQVAQNKLNGCGIQSELPSDDANVKDTQAVPQTADYLYQVELGVTRLVINKTLFSASLTGEAEARITENNQISKRIYVDAFGGGKATLEKFGTEGAESDAELKAATSKVVDHLANRLGDKLCNYFH